jgi:hypothetical protein
MTKALKLGQGFSLPIDAVTEPIGIFANRGKGKSNTAHRFVEQLYLSDLPSVVLDIKGDWYGIRASVDGKGPGFPFLIFGGTHADVPLEPGSGTQVAQFVSEHRVPTIIDLSGFSKTAARRWTMEFAEELYRVNTEPLMVVVDEADVLIPQRLSNDLMRLLGAMEDIAKRGRQRGLGITVISQRVADVNKAVTDLLETLFLFAVTGTRTRKAILEWIDDHADPEEAKAVVATLSSLPPGEGWVWSPGWLHLLKRVVFLRPETFDSHATPKAGERRRSIKTMANVDLAAIKEQMAETIERAKAEDPKELRKKINDLETIIAKTPKVTETKEVVVEVRVEVPYVPKAVVDLVDELEEALLQRSAAVSNALRKLGNVAKNIGVRDEVEARVPAPAKKVEKAIPVQAKTLPTPSPRPSAPRVDMGDVKLGKGHRKTLEVLAENPEGLMYNKLAFLAGYSAKASTLGVYLSELRKCGLVEPATTDGFVRATVDGLAAAGGAKERLTGQALLDKWLNHKRMGEGHRKVLLALIDAYPEVLSHEELCDVTGYSPDASTIGVYLSELRKLGLIEKGQRRVPDEFMESIR